MKKHLIDWLRKAADILETGQDSARQRKAILEAVASHHKITTTELVKKHPRGSARDARKMAASLLYHAGDLTMTTIGGILGIDHTSVSYAIKSNNEFCDQYPEYKETYNQIKSKL